MQLIEERKLLRMGAFTSFRNPLFIYREVLEKQRDRSHRESGRRMLEQTAGRQCRTAEGEVF